MTTEEERSAASCACVDSAPATMPAPPLVRSACAQQPSVPMAPRVYGSGKNNDMTIFFVIFITFLACWAFSHFKGYEALDKLFGKIFKHKPKAPAGEMPEAGGMEMPEGPGGPAP